MTRNVIERFVDKVDVKDFWSCWEWKAGKDENGYGRFLLDGENRRATRVLWRLTYGHWPTELVLHRCDNPPCVNILHLYDGSRSDNLYDSVVAGTHVNSRKSHCKRGHPLNSGNAYTHPDGKRVCRPCRRMMDRERNRGGVDR